MELILTPAGGGQPVVLGMPGATQQGALNLTSIVTEISAVSDTILIVRAGQLMAFAVPAAFAIAANPSPFDQTAPSAAEFLLQGAA
jgi:hypothetical protein